MYLIGFSMSFKIQIAVSFANMITFQFLVLTRQLSKAIASYREEDLSGGNLVDDDGWETRVSFHLDFDFRTRSQGKICERWRKIDLLLKLN